MTNDELVASQLEELAEISKWLRRERELAFYGEVDFIPTEEYTKEDALKAIEGARKTVKAAEEVIEAVL